MRIILLTYFLKVTDAISTPIRISTPFCFISKKKSVSFKFSTFIVPFYSFLVTAGLRLYKAGSSAKWPSLKANFR